MKFFWNLIGIQIFFNHNSKSMIMNRLTFASVLTLAVFSLLPFMGYGQSETEAKTTSTPEERAEKLTTWMTEKLFLTENQIEEVTPLNLEYAKKAEEIKNSSDSRMSKFKELKSLEEEKDKKLKNIFTESQFKTYNDKKKELRKAFKENYKEQ